MDKLSRQVFDIIQKYEYSEDDFDTDQLTEIYLGFKNGLSERQISTYTIPSLNADQMVFCRRCGEKGFNVEQLKQISIGFINGITESQIKLYAGPKYDSEQMEQIRRGLQNGLSIEQLREKYDFFRPDENLDIAGNIQKTTGHEIEM